MVRTLLLSYWVAPRRTQHMCFCFFFELDGRFDFIAAKACWSSACITQANTSFEAFEFGTLIAICIHHVQAQYSHHIQLQSLRLQEALALII